MIQLQPVGVVHSPFAEPGSVPRYAAERANANGTIEVFPEYREGLKDLDSFSHVVLIWRFHRSDEELLTATPPYDVGMKGVFATRSPKRPNSLGLSVVELERIEDGIVHIRNFDMADGTPVLDIKPYIPDGVDADDVKLGWLEAVRPPTAVATVQEHWRRMQTNDFSYAAELLAKDFVLEWPLSNERIRGKDNFIAVNEEYPANGRWTFDVHRCVGNAREVVTDVSVSDGTIKARAITFSYVEGGVLRRQVEYWPEKYPAPRNRAHLVEPLE